jgi:hypothetical protein
MDGNKRHHKDFKKELNLLLSRIHALEASSNDREQKSLMAILMVLAENQKHFVEEFEHLKKAIDLLTLQLFKIDQGKK